MKKNLKVMATSIALSMGMVLTSPAYAGVVKRNATGAAVKAAEEQKKADEKKENETQVSSETSSQGQGDQTEQAHAGLKDQTPTEQATQPQKEIGRDNPMTVFPRADYLGPDGVAKDPSYVTSNFEVQVDKTISQCIHSTADARWLKMRTEPFVYPEINPDTGYPLWSTKPFWRTDGSFDVYGYLKQFVARKKDQTTQLFVFTDRGKWDNSVTGMQLSLYNYYAENPPYIPTDGDHFDLWLDFPAKKRPENDFERKYRKRETQLMATDFHFYEGNIHWRGYIDIDTLDTQPTVKITGSENSYIYIAQVDMLEKTMRNYLMNPYKKSDDIRDFDGTEHFTGMMYDRDFGND